MQGKIYDCADDAEREEGVRIATKAAKSGRWWSCPLTHSTAWAAMPLIMMR